MENTVGIESPEIGDVSVVTDADLLKKYEEVIRSWGYDGIVLNIGLHDSMLSFLHDGYIATCPVESETVHTLRVKVANEIEECSAYT